MDGSGKRTSRTASGCRWPIHLTFDDHPPMTERVWVDAAEVTVELPLPARPTRIEFNHQHAVLAKVR